MILDGKLRSGEKLIQQDLARQFGVSQSVVREALFELQPIGLVESIDNRGIFVGKIDARSLVESFDVREAHECLAVRLCCQTASRADLAQLTELAQRMCSIGQSGDIDGMSLLDREFHQRLLQLAGNGMLLRLAETHRTLGKVVQVGRPPEVIRDEHVAIVRAIEANRAQKAERLMRQHIQAAKRIVEEQIENGELSLRWVR